MKNIEKYKDVLLNSETNDLTCCVIDLFHNGKCPDSCKVCKQKAMAWLLSEYDGSILDGTEKKYLESVIKPFRNRVTSVRKWYNGIDYRIIIALDNNENLCQLPRFPVGYEMYMGLDINKCYTLQELGL